MQPFNELPLSKYGSHCYYDLHFYGTREYSRVARSVTAFGGSCAPGTGVCVWQALVEIEHYSVRLFIEWLADYRPLFCDYSGDGVKTCHVLMWTEYCSFSTRDDHMYIQLLIVPGTTTCISSY